MKDSRSSWAWSILLGITFQLHAAAQNCPNAVDYVDPLYGGKIRQLNQPLGHEHNIYYHRNPWNADGSHMIGIQSDLQQQNWRIVLYSGDGCYVKDLFQLAQYDWRLSWDRSDPDILYTWKGPNLYRYHVSAGNADLLRSFAPLNLGVNGPSLNQAGDRILVITSDRTFRSYRLPDMQDERTFTVTFPAGCSTDWEDERYIGYQNYIATTCISQDLTEQHMYIYDDNGELFHQFDGVSLGHTDFSPNGRWAYGRMWGGGKPLEVHLVDLSGANDRTLYQVPQAAASFVQNFHVSWPDRISDWFLVSFFPSAANLPATYGAPLDEILLIHIDGTRKFLARTETSVTSRGEMFWSEPLASPSSDGRHISFNSIRSGTIDQYILMLEESRNRRRAVKQ